jgi:acyl-CoA synthetase (AMP-forming)/AMP-acid ligase II
VPAFCRSAADADPEGFALVDERGRWTWGEIDQILNRVANQLLTADLGPDHRVAVFAENGAEVALAHLGALLAGASSVPVNFHLTAEETSYILSDSGARVLFVGPETAARGIEAAKGTDVHTIVAWSPAGTDGTDGPAGTDGTAGTDGAGEMLVDWDKWLAEGDPSDPPMDVVPRPNLLYTSGTTGRPKGTDLPPTMFAGGDDMAAHLDALGQSSMAGIGPHLVVGPMYHTGPLSGMRLLAAGVPSVILGRFDAEATLAAIDRYKTASAIMVPTHFVRMLALPDEVKARYDLSSMKTIPHTGAKCPVEVKAAMIEWFGPVFRDAYGASEVGTVCSITSEEWMDKQGSVGRSIEPFTAVVFDDDMNEVPPGTEGRLFFRDATGRGIVYPNDPEKTAASNPEPGLFTLGEIGYVDADGYVFITDRFSDMVVSGGANLYPAEVEQVLIDHPAVADCACIGVPHPDLGEELIALVVAEDGVTVDVGEMAGWLLDRLTKMKCPRRFEVVAHLGRNTMGKINKRRLRDAYLAGELRP